MKKKVLKPGSEDGRPPVFNSGPMVTVGLRIPVKLASQWKGIGTAAQRGIIVSGLNGLSGRVAPKRLSELDKGRNSFNRG